MDYPRFTPDGKTVSFTVDDWEARIYTLKLLDFATGKELASFPCPDKDVIMLGGEFSPDGSILMATMSPLKGGCATILFLEGKTLAERGRFACPRAPDGSCAVGSKFMPDGKSCLILDAAGTAHIWDLASQKEARSIEVGAPSGTMTFSRDGKTLAVAWAPERPAELKGVRNVDPRDLAQPRVTIVDLAGSRPPRTLIAPHGYQGGIAFSPNGKILAFGTSGGVRLFDLTR
jgi:WD40 repeat protein